MKYGIIKVKRAFLHEENVVDVVDEVFFGWSVMWEDEGEWIEVWTHYGYRGWMERNLIEEKSREWMEEREKAGNTYVVTRGFADVMRGARVQSRMLETLGRGCFVEKMEETENGYCRVKLANGISGFVPEVALRKRLDSDRFLWGKSEERFFVEQGIPEGWSEEKFRRKVVECAKGYLGCQYRWGGKAADGIDCSGVVFMVYLMNGVLIWRDADIREGYPMKAIWREGEEMCLVEEQLGQDQINRYNMYSTASLTCNVAPGSSTGQAIQEVEALFKEQLGDEFGYEWTSVAYQETQAGNTTTIVLVMALIVAFLVLAAQYESWTSPVAAVIGLPVALLGAMIGCLVMGTPVSIYTQIGIILLVALSAKNGILIVEFARDFHAEGNSIRESAFEAGHVRLRPILMTSFAFVLGVMPLLFASGAGAQSRIALGAAVVFGMAMNTLLATVYIPNFYELMQKLQEKFSKKKGNNDKQEGSM